MIGEFSLKLPRCQGRGFSLERNKSRIQVSLLLKAEWIVITLHILRWISAGYFRENISRLPNWKDKFERNSERKFQTILKIIYFKRKREEESNIN